MKGRDSGGPPERQRPRAHHSGLPAAVLLLVLALLTSATAYAAAPPANPPLAASHLRALGPTGHSAHRSLQCDGMLWKPALWAKYAPSYCYGHDEPTVSYLSSVAGSGGNASFSLTLPADARGYSQGSFFATFWIGGTVYDTASTAGGKQAFLEFQFYPAAPQYTGTGSGTKDCLPNGAFAPVFTAGSNQWFACAIVWQLAGSSLSPVEDAGFAGPLDSGSTSAILVLHSNDRIFVNATGTAKSTTTPWKLALSDATAGTGGTISLVNGSLVLSPYYSTAASGNTLSWGASNPGAVAFAYEVGHALNSSIPQPGGACSPGDGACPSYWPGLWGKLGAAEIELPTMGSGPNASFPSQVAFSSSQGGSAEVNSSTCGSPSFSTSSNCMYPYFQYRGANYSYDFGASNVVNATHTYGNEYQFPSSSTSSGQWAARVATAPWGTLSVTVAPATASAEVNRIGQTSPLPLTSGSATRQEMEGPYWLNVSAANCTPSSTAVYVSPGKSYPLPVNLACGVGAPLSASAGASRVIGVAPLLVNFTGSASGGKSPYSYSWTFGDGGTSATQNPSHTYTAAGNYTAVLTVSDSNSSVANASIAVHVTASTPTPSCAGQTTTITLGTLKACYLAKAKQTVFKFAVTKAQWSSWFYLDVYEVDGAVNGTQPVFKMGTGLGGTPSLAHAKQTAVGPGAKIQIALSTQAAGRYGGWGTYWAIVTSPGGSGGFCFEATLSNAAPGSGPTCTAHGIHPLGVGALGGPPAGRSPAPDLRPTVAPVPDEGAAMAVRPMHR